MFKSPWRPRARLLSLLVLIACRKAEPPAAAVETPALQQASTTAPPVAEPQPSAAAGQPMSHVGDDGLAQEKPFPRAGWTPRRVRDALPLCVFSSMAEREKAQHLQDARAKQVLRANAKVVFGVFGPNCLNEECDARPTVQCWTEQSSNTLTVNSRFFSFHRDGSSCNTDCLEVDTACETEPLKAGKYTIRYGDKTYKLQVPSTMKDPCLSRE
jgi:hypothetical protein